MRRFGVFAGGFTLEAAEWVDDRGGLSLNVLDGLASLIDKGLVRARHHDDRFAMLETIRTFAGEKLEASGEGEHIRRAHADFRRLSEEWTPHLMGAAQRDWLDRLERERANLRAALDWSLKGEAAEPALTISVNLWRYWRFRGTTMEWRNWLSTPLPFPRQPRHYGRAPPSTEYRLRAQRRL